METINVKNLRLIKFFWCGRFKYCFFLNIQCLTGHYYTIELLTGIVGLLDGFILSIDAAFAMFVLS